MAYRQKQRTKPTINPTLREFIPEMTEEEETQWRNVTIESQLDTLKKKNSEHRARRPLSMDTYLGDDQLGAHVCAQLMRDSSQRGGPTTFNLGEMNVSDRGSSVSAYERWKSTAEGAVMLLYSWGRKKAGRYVSLSLRFGSFPFPRVWGLPVAV